MQNTTVPRTAITMMRTPAHTPKIVAYFHGISSSFLVVLVGFGVVIETVVVVIVVVVPSEIQSIGVTSKFHH